MLLKRKGALPAEQIKALHKQSSIKCLRPLTDNQIQPASMDLRLSKKCWEVEASFLPGPVSYTHLTLPTSQYV